MDRFQPVPEVPQVQVKTGELPEMDLEKKNVARSGGSHEGEDDMIKWSPGMKSYIDLECFCANLWFMAYL